MSKSKKFINQIVLIGFMGAGKTHCAHALARELSWRELDSDIIIERREKKSIARIFKVKGESYFRTIESKVIKDLLLKPQTVLAFGGGAVCRKVNRTLIKKRAFVIWLKSSPEVIYRRTRRSKNRPLLNGANPRRIIATLVKERDPLYRECADVIVPNNGGAILPKLSRIPQIRMLIKRKKEWVGKSK